MKAWEQIEKGYYFSLGAIFGLISMFGLVMAIGRLIDWISNYFY